MLPLTPKKLRLLMTSRKKSQFSLKVRMPGDSHTLISMGSTSELDTSLKRKTEAINT